MSRHCAVIDVGKTHVKLHLLDDALNCRARLSRDNPVLCGPPYPHYDIDGLWRWMCAGLAQFAAAAHIDRLAVTTHGACAALLDPAAGAAGLALPVMDYEFEHVARDADYAALRPAFAQTFSPALPAGLNLGRQLSWQRRHHRAQFERAHLLLPYPQYWAWRLTGRAVAEFTSWGCHTDLWAPAARDYSDLVDALGLRDKLPPLVGAGEVVGALSAEVAAQTGLPGDCRVVAGVHDSNASYLRYLGRGSAGAFTVVSTGTWVITFASGASLSALDERRDMLANVDINGDPVPCARFMGGREFQAICARSGAAAADAFSAADVQRVIDDGVLALPDFSGGSGPFGGRAPCIQGGSASGPALASLYCALMLDYELELLRATGDIVIEGAWLRNAPLCALLAQLRPRRAVRLSRDATGTVSGAAQLALGVSIPPALDTATPGAWRGLDEYRRRWRNQLGGAG